MKNKVKSIIILLFLSIIAFNSCSKKENARPVDIKSTTGTKNIEKIQNDLRVINSKYVGNKNFAQKTTSPNGWAAAGADITTAALTIKSVWSWCATGWGGVLAGAVVTVATAVASYGAYNAMVVPSNDRGDQKDRIVQMVGTYVIPNPHMNPYESLAQGHNQKVKLLCQNAVQLNTTTLMYNSQDLSQTELTAIATDSTYMTYNACAFMTANNIINSQTGEIDIDLILNNHFQNDTLLHGIFSTFFAAYQQMGDDSTAIALINDYEEYFMDQQLNISDVDRASVLAGLAVGKYSTAMWHDAFTNF